MIERLGLAADGRELLGVTLSSGGLTARFLNIGAVLQDLRIEGWSHPLVLGYPDAEFYLKNPAYLGAMAGPVANRIANAQAEIAGVQFHFDRNTEEGHTLHGGAGGTGHRLWSLGDTGHNWVEFQDTLKDGHMGFPGNRQVTIRYTLLENAQFDIQISATTDATTLMNFAHHSYFTLTNAGQDGSHELQISAQEYLPLDGTGVPTGEMADVAESRLDFRTPKELLAGGPDDEIDQNFCLSAGQCPIRNVATLTGQKTGLSMNVASTEAGLQVYTGQRLDRTGPIGLHGRSYGANDGIALEAQNWPDAPNHPNFPSALLRQNEEYFQNTRYGFAKV